MSDPRHDIARDLGAAVLKAAPPAAVWSLTSNQVVALFTVGYIVLQAAHLVWKWRGEAKRKREIDGLMSGPVPPYKPRPIRDVSPPR